jgi:DNA primase
MDVITAHQSGFSNVVASMGTSITETQVNTLKKLSKNLILALDADEAGEEAMLRCVGYENTIDAEIKVIILPSGMDPDEVIREDAQAWQELVKKSLPVIDYTFNMVTSKLDLTTARDKSSAADKLLHIIADIKDAVRQAHYLQKLARLVNINDRSLEAALRRTKPDRRAKEPRREAVTHALCPLLSSPVEEYCLALLLHHPRLKNDYKGLSAEYFENSENREIFASWQQVNDLQSLKERLDTNIHEHLNSLVTKSSPSTQTEQKYADCVLRLREKLLRSLEGKKKAALEAEAESGGTAAELAKLEEQGIDVSIQLGEVFAQKGRRKLETRR